MLYAVCIHLINVYKVCTDTVYDIPFLVCYLSMYAVLNEINHRGFSIPVTCRSLSFSIKLTQSRTYYSVPALCIHCHWCPLTESMSAVWLCVARVIKWSCKPLHIEEHHVEKSQHETVRHLHGNGKRDILFIVKTLSEHTDSIRFGDGKTVHGVLSILYGINQMINGIKTEKPRRHVGQGGTICRWLHIVIIFYS